MSSLILTSPRLADEALAQSVRQGAMPLVIGGDDSIPPITVRALTDSGPFDFVTTDAAPLRRGATRR